MDYTPSSEMVARIENDFTYHTVVEEQATRMQTIRDACRNLAMLLVKSTPPTREQSLALTALETVSMWANAAIARHELPNA